MLRLFASARIVPFDPSIDTPLGHRNLVLIYVMVGLVQLAYAAYTLHKWRVSGRQTKSSNSLDS
jgi:hypothetical protein